MTLVAVVSPVEAMVVVVVVVIRLGMLVGMARSIQGSRRSWKSVHTNVTRAGWFAHHEAQGRDIAGGVRGGGGGIRGGDGGIKGSSRREDGECRVTVMDGNSGNVGLLPPSSRLVSVALYIVKCTLLCVMKPSRMARPVTSKMQSDLRQDPALRASHAVVLAPEDLEREAAVPNHRKRSRPGRAG